jgi:hypothetical protein
VLALADDADAKEKRRRKKMKGCRRLTLLTLCIRVLQVSSTVDDYSFCCCCF